MSIQIGSIQNEQTICYSSSGTKKLANSLMSSKKKQKYLQKQFKPITHEQNMKKTHSSSKYFEYSTCLNNETQFQQQNPIRPTLKQKQNQLMTKFSKQIKSNKSKLIYDKYQSIYSSTKHKLNKSHSKDQFHSNKLPQNINKKLKTQVTNFDQKQYCTATKNNLSLNRLRNSLLHVRQLKQEKIIEHSSSKKKGLQCTLYERSLQKKIPQNDSKYLSIKVKSINSKNNEVTQYNLQTPSRKIILRKKQQPNYIQQNKKNINHLNCFNSITLNIDRQQKQKIEKHRTRTQISSSLTKKQLSKQNPLRSSKSKHIPTQTSKRITMNQKTQQTLQKLHENFKFVFNYMTEFEIIAQINGFQLIGEDSCKWTLLIIDHVYQMIKHSEQTKLKGIQHTRDFTYNTTNQQY